MRPGLFTFTMQEAQKPQKLKCSKIGQSRCIYCGSTAYGRGCPYGPRGVHFHPSDPTKCAYCGSTQYGTGCRINPFNNLHVHGINYNMMLPEFIQQKLQKEIIMDYLLKPHIKLKAYKLGLINENGEIIKEPTTNEERAALGPYDEFLLKLRKKSSEIELMKLQQELKEESTLPVSLEKYERFVEHKNAIQDAVNQVFIAAEKAQQEGLSIEQILACIKKLTFDK